MKFPFTQTDRATLLNALDVAERTYQENAEKMHRMATTASDAPGSLITPEGARLQAQTLDTLASETRRIANEIRADAED